VSDGLPVLILCVSAFVLFGGVLAWGSWRQNSKERQKA
jgi:hypothetical protein